MLLLNEEIWRQAGEAPATLFLYKKSCDLSILHDWLLKSLVLSLCSSKWSTMVAQRLFHFELPQAHWEKKRGGVGTEEGRKRTGASKWSFTLIDQDDKLENCGELRNCELEFYDGFRWVNVLMWVYSPWNNIGSCQKEDISIALTVSRASIQSMFWDENWYSLVYLINCALPNSQQRLMQECRNRMHFETMKIVYRFYAGWSWHSSCFCFYELTLRMKIKSIWLHSIFRKQ